MRHIWRGFLLAAGASALVACASHGPTSPTGTAATSGSVPVAGATAPDAEKSAVPKGYRRVVRKGTEYYCRTQKVTGSHTMTSDVCITRDEYESQWNHGEALGLNPGASPAQVGGGMPAR
jgi:hypothetical protein